MMLTVELYPAMARALGVSEFGLEVEDAEASWRRMQGAICGRLCEMGGRSFCRGDELAGPIVALLNGQPAGPASGPLRDGDVVRLLYVVSGG